jgi:hypothetical protein
MTEKQIKQKLRSLYKGWSLSGLTEQEQDIEFNKLLEQLTIPVVSKAFYCLEGGIKGSEHVCKKQCDSCNRFQQ